MIWIDRSIEYMLALETNKKENQKLSSKKIVSGSLICLRHFYDTLPSNYIKI